MQLSVPLFHRGRPQSCPFTSLVVRKVKPGTARTLERRASTVLWGDSSTPCASDEADSGCVFVSPGAPAQVANSAAVTECGRRVVATADGIATVASVFMDENTYMLLGSLVFGVVSMAPEDTVFLHYRETGEVVDLSTSRDMRERIVDGGSTLHLSVEPISYVDFCANGAHVVCASQNGLLGCVHVDWEHADAMHGCLLGHGLTGHIVSIAGVRDVAMCAVLMMDTGERVAVFDTFTAAILHVFQFSPAVPPHLPVGQSAITCSALYQCGPVVAVDDERACFASDILVVSGITLTVTKATVVVAVRGSSAGAKCGAGAGGSVCATAAPGGASQRTNQKYCSCGSLRVPQPLVDTVHSTALLCSQQSVARSISSTSLYGGARGLISHVRPHIVTFGPEMRHAGTMPSPALATHAFCTKLAPPPTLACLTTPRSATIIHSATGEVLATIDNSTASPFVACRWRVCCRCARGVGGALHSSGLRCKGTQGTTGELSLSRTDGTLSVYHLQFANASSEDLSEVEPWVEVVYANELAVATAHAYPLQSCPLQTGLAADATCYLAVTPSLLWDLPPLPTCRIRERRMTVVQGALSLVVAAHGRGGTAATVPVHMISLTRRPLTCFTAGCLAPKVVHCGVVTFSGVPSVICFTEHGECTLRPLFSSETADATCRFTHVVTLLQPTDAEQPPLTCFLLLETSASRPPQATAAAGVPPLCHLITGHADGSVTVWQCGDSGHTTGAARQTTIPLAHGAAVSYIQILPAGLERFEAAFLSVSQLGGSVALHSTTTFECTRVFQSPRQPLTSVFWDDREDYILLMSGGMGNLWHLPTCRLERLMDHAELSDRREWPWMKQNILDVPGDAISDMMEVELTRVGDAQYFTLSLRIDTVLQQLDREIERGDCLLSFHVRCVISVVLAPLFRMPAFAQHDHISATLQLPALNDDTITSWGCSNSLLWVGAPHVTMMMVVCAALGSRAEWAGVSKELVGCLTTLVETTSKAVPALPASVAMVSLPMLLSSRVVIRNAARRCLIGAVRLLNEKEFDRLLGRLCTIRSPNDLMALWSGHRVNVDGGPFAPTVENACAGLKAIYSTPAVGVITGDESDSDGARFFATMSILSQAAVAAPKVLSEKSDRMLSDLAVLLQVKVLAMLESLQQRCWLPGHATAGTPPKSSQQLAPALGANLVRASPAEGAAIGTVGAPSTTTRGHFTSDLRFFLLILGEWWGVLGKRMTAPSAVMEGLCSVYYAAVPQDPLAPHLAAPPPCAELGADVVRRMAITEVEPFLKTHFRAMYDRLPESRAQLLGLLGAMAVAGPEECFSVVQHILPFVWRALDPHNPNRRERAALVGPVTSLLRVLVAYLPNLSFQQHLQHLVVGMADGEVVVYNLKSTTTIAGFYSHTAPIACVSYSSNTAASDLAVVSVDLDCVKVWRAGKPSGILGLMLSAASSATFQLHRTLPIPPRVSPVDGTPIPFAKLLSAKVITRECRLRWLSPRCLELTTPWHHKLQLTL